MLRNFQPVRFCLKEVDILSSISIRDISAKKYHIPQTISKEWSLYHRNLNRNLVSVNDKGGGGMARYQ